jgi:Major Facilitator Superfamily
MSAPSPKEIVSSPSTGNMMLFYASFLTLIAAGIGFSVRGAVLSDWGKQFSFTQSELGTITGGGLVGFGLTIIVLSFFADLIGYGRLMALAFLLHLSSAIVTFAATPVYGTYGKEGAFWCLNIGMWLFALGNGTCEAVINPLTASLFPKNKTHWLNILHAGWPGGLIIGALVVLGFNVLGDIRWEFKLGVFLIPTLMYGLLMIGKTFPKSEASTTGVGLGTMVVTLFAPMLLFLFLLHALVGYVELGTDSWIINITETVLANGTMALLAFIWTNLLMFCLRFFAGPIVHKINPIGLLFVSACLGATGLYLLGQPFTGTAAMWLAAVTVYGIGKTFYWPTMLGVISERFPSGGALALGISGGIGMISAGMLGGPGIGYKQDYFAVQSLEAKHMDTYHRYESLNDKGEPNKSGFPYLSDIMPDKLPKIAGLDNAKLKVFDDYKGIVDAKKDDSLAKTTLESDLAVLNNVIASGGQIEPKLKENLESLHAWWQKEGKPHFTEDRVPLDEARLHGGKHALLATALVPAAMAVGFLLLFVAMSIGGGYKQVHLETRH